MRNIVISTGAGISAESGVHTYRDLDGLWTKYDPTEVMDIRGWKNDPAKVIDFMNMLRRTFVEAEYVPNAAHYALAKLQREWKDGTVTIITQNIDNLHQKAGASIVLDIHGNGSQKVCEHCGNISDYDADIVLSDSCKRCGSVASIKPNIVMFGEVPHHLYDVDQALTDCSIFAVIGSSGEVHPANTFASKAHNHGAETWLLNKEIPTKGSLWEFDKRIYGSASIAVPNWVDQLLV